MAAQSLTAPRLAVTAPAAPGVAPATLAHTPASADTRRLAAWVLSSGDNGALPFLIIDKVDARVFAFTAGGRLLDAAPALLGLGRGDRSPIGIGTRKLADIPVGERITPSGRFIAGLGPDLGKKDVLWVDYDAAIALHAVYTGTPSEHRLERLATPSVLDNRVSWGCINVPARFYDDVVHPLFAGTQGVVYVLPEARSLTDVFPGIGTVSAIRVLAAR